MKDTVTTPAATPNDPYLSLRELVKYSSLSINTIRAHLTNLRHPLPHFRVGGRILVRQSEFDRWVTQQRADPTERLNQIVNKVMTDLRSRRTPVLK